MVNKLLISVAALMAGANALPHHAQSSDSVPVPNARQLDFMELEFTQFMHFGAPTFWNPPEEYLYLPNPTYHDCKTTNIDHGNQTAGYYPCLNPDVFFPTDLNTDDWMEASAALGMKEIIITAHHEGGFALWPSKFTPYGVAASKWRDGKGDVLREFADSANKWGIKISYYLNVQCDGYMTYVGNYTDDDFIRRQVGMITEVMENYGPVNRFWFDGTHDFKGDLTTLWDQVYKTIRTVSPDTMISSYRGDICSSPSGGTVYTNNGPPPNTTDSTNCQPAMEGGEYFHPTELHGITIQEGPDGNSDAQPTYWFWHPWACAKNITGCPWVGHANASRIFDSYIVTVGRGATLNMNIPPERTGRMNTSVVEVMKTAGKAINDTFKQSVGMVGKTSSQCIEGVSEIALDGKTEFDYVMIMEDMVYGQRFGNYSVEFQTVGSNMWEMLVPPVIKNNSMEVAASVGDRPDGHDPRDSHIGHKRIDLPIVTTSGSMALKISKVRLNCIRAIAEPVYVRQFSLHKKTVPWE